MPVLVWNDQIAMVGECNSDDSNVTEDYSRDAYDSDGDDDYNDYGGNNDDYSGGNNDDYSGGNNDDYSGGNNDDYSGGNNDDYSGNNDDYGGNNDDYGGNNDDYSGRNNDDYGGNNDDYSGGNNDDYSGSNNDDYSGGNNDDYSGGNNDDYSGNNDDYGGNNDDYGGNNDDYSGGNNDDYSGSNNDDYSGGNNDDYSGGNNDDYSGGNNDDYGGGNNDDYSGGNNDDYGGNNDDYSGGNNDDYSGGNNDDFGGNNDGGDYDRTSDDYGGGDDDTVDHESKDTEDYGDVGDGDDEDGGNNVEYDEDNAGEGAVGGVSEDSETVGCDEDDDDDYNFEDNAGADDADGENEDNYYDTNEFHVTNEHTTNNNIFINVTENTSVNVPSASLNHDVPSASLNHAGIAHHSHQNVNHVTQHNTSSQNKRNLHVHPAKPSKIKVPKRTAPLTRPASGTTTKPNGYALAENTNKPNSHVKGTPHRGIKCDQCKVLPIMGRRWICNVCSDYDLCDKCYISRRHNRLHKFLCIIEPVEDIQKGNWLVHNRTVAKKESQNEESAHLRTSLPPGWEERVLSDGKKVYLNHKTHKTQWEQPTHEGSSLLPSGWEERVLSDGNKVYLNHKTHKTQWERPTHESELLVKKEEKQAATKDLPDWVPDSISDHCMVCKTSEFTIFNRRHHCRACGALVCGPCSEKTWVLPKQSPYPQRVCDPCWNTKLAHASDEDAHNLPSTHGNCAGALGGIPSKTNPVSRVPITSGFNTDKTNPLGGISWYVPLCIKTNPVCSDPATSSLTTKSNPVSGDSITSGLSELLPPEWETRELSDGRTVYLNHKTHKTQWEKPVGGISSKTNPVNSDPATSGLTTKSNPVSGDSITSGLSELLPPEWETRELSDGQTVYLNHKTHKTQWEKPVGGISSKTNPVNSDPATSGLTTKSNPVSGDSITSGLSELLLSGADDRTVYRYLNHKTHKSQWNKPAYAGAVGTSETIPSAPPMSSDEISIDSDIDFRPQPGFDNILKINPEQDTETILKENKVLREQRTCKICLDAEISCVFIPCGHLVCCSTCAPEMTKCPICRANILQAVKAYMS